MNCIYTYQLSDESPVEHLQKPDDFKSYNATAEYHKNTVTFTDPTAHESDRYVHSVGYEVAAPDKFEKDIRFIDKTTLYYVIEGEGYFDDRLLRHGSCFVAKSDKAHSIATKEGKPLVYAWITVAHTRELPLSSLGLQSSDGIIKYNFEAELRQIIYTMQNFNPKTHDVYFFTMGKFLELLSYHNADKEIVITAKAASVSNGRYVALVKEMLEAAEYKISIEDVAKALGFSRKYLSMIFCKTMGLTLRDYISQKKIERAKRMLINGEASLKTIAFQLNYNDYSSFSRAFKKESGITPHEYVSSHMILTED